MIEKARARRKDLVERQTRLLQSHGPKKSDVQVRAAPGNKSIRAVIQSFDRIESTELAPCILGELELCLDPPCHYRLMISVVHNQHRTSWKAGGKLGLEPVPGHGGLYEPCVVFGIASIGKAFGGKGTLVLKVSGRDQLSVVRAVIKVCQRI